MPGTPNREMRHQVTYWGHHFSVGHGGSGVEFNSLSPSLKYGRCPCSHITAEAIKQGSLKESLRKGTMVILADIMYSPNLISLSSAKGTCD